MIHCCNNATFLIALHLHLRKHREQKAGFFFSVRDITSLQISQRSSLSRSDYLNLAVGFNPRKDNHTSIPSRQRRLIF